MLFIRCCLSLALLAQLSAASAGIIQPPGPPDPIHTLVQTLAGDYDGLADQTDPRFGFSVALHGDTLAVGAPGTRVASGAQILERGVVFIYRRNPNNDSWQLTQRLLTLTGGAAQCGHAVALNDFSLIVGCPFFSNRGRAVIYARSNTTADFEDPITFVDTSVQSGAQCGTSVALIDSAPGTDSALPMAAVGCPNRRDFPAGDIGLVGGVDIYRNFFGQWALATSLVGPSTGTSGFGHSLSLNRAGPNPGQTLLLAVGIPGTTATAHGSVRIYAMGATVANWSQEHSILGPSDGARFGTSVHMRLGRLAIGAPERRVLNVGLQPPANVPSGSLSITTRVCTLQGSCSWSQTVDEIAAMPIPIAAHVAQNRFGAAVQALTPNRIIAGAPLFPIGSFAGQAQHFVLDAGNWELNEDEPFYPVAPVSATAQFGSALSGNEDWLAVGAPGFPDVDNTGRVFVYAFDYDDTIFANDFECDDLCP